MTDRAQLEHRLQTTLAEGQDITARVERLLTANGPMEPKMFDRLLEQLRQQEVENHRQMEQVMTQLQALDDQG